LNSKNNDNQSIRPNSQLANDISTISKNESNRNNQNNQYNQVDELNESLHSLHSTHSILTNDDISLLKNNNNRIEKGIVDKALLYNKDKYDDVVPFHLKYFMENPNNTNTESDNQDNNTEFDFLDKKSSYFKTRNKEQFLKNLTEMTKLDSKLYDKTQIYDKTKGETKKLLMTEITQYYDDGLKSSAKEKDEEMELGEIKEDNEEAKQDKELNNKLKGMLELYKDIDKKQKNQERNNKFKNFITPQAPNMINSKAVKNYIEINKSELYGKNLNKYAYPKINTKIEDYDNLIEYKPLSNANLDNIEDQMEVDYGYFSKSQLGELSEIDKKLEQLNSKYIENSINNEIKKIKGNIMIDSVQEKIGNKKEPKDYLQSKRE